MYPFLDNNGISFYQSLAKIIYRKAAKTAKSKRRTIPPILILLIFKEYQYFL